MKRDMRKILTTTSVMKFQQYKEEYFEILREKNEFDFIKYLEK